MAYTKVQWRNNQSPPINADNLNHIEEGIYEAHQTMAENTQNIESLTTQTNANTSAITSEIIARQQADTAETLAREQTDNSLQSQINQIIAPSGEAPSAAEVENARIAASVMGGETYDTLGNAIRGQVTDLKSEINEIATPVLSKNLANNADIVAGFIEDTGNVSTYSSYANYSTTDYIELEPNTDYTISAFIQDTLEKVSYGRFATLLFDSSRSPITNSYINEITPSSRTISNSNARYIRISYYNTVSDPRYIQLEEGTEGTSYEPYSETWVLNGNFELDGTIKTLQEALDEKISTVKHNSKNLINPATVSEEKFLDGAGALVDYSNYATCDYIPIEANQSVTFSPAIRSALLYDEGKTPIEGTYYNDYVSTPVTMTATVDGYVRASFFMSQKGTWQAEYGTRATPYTPFDNNDYFPENIKLSNSMISEVEALVEAVDDEHRRMTVSVNGSLLTVSVGEFERLYNIPQSTRNENFNFVQANLNGVSIKDSSDDITPQRLRVNGAGMWTVGANHGWPVYKVSVGSLTEVDIGSVWTDGDRQFTLGVVNSSYAWFLFPCTKSTEAFNFSIDAPIANLTHVSGATHTSTVSISGGVVDQLYPSVNHDSIILKINGEMITENGIYYCDEFDIIEYYEIMDYAAMNTYLKEHIGSSLSDVKDNIDSVLALDYVYHITPNGEVVYSTATALEGINIANSGFMQSAIMNANGNTIYRYVNGVKSDAFFNSASLVNMTNYNTSRTIAKSELVDSSKPTNRCVDVAKNSNGKIQYGFAFGFIPDISDGADSKRAIMDSSYIWDMRDSKKSYPLCISNKTLSVGESINIVGYRYYITETQEETNKTIISIGNKKYVFIDSHVSIADAVSIDDYGEDVTVLDSSSMNISDVVGAKGVTFNSDESYSYAVLKLT